MLQTLTDITDDELELMSQNSKTYTEYCHTEQPC